MTADPKSIDLTSLMTGHLERAEPAPLRSVLKTFVEALMSTQRTRCFGIPTSIVPARVSPSRGR